MNYGPLVFLGIFFSFTLSWLGMIFGPQLQIGKQQIVTIEETGQRYPSAPSGQANQGEQLYRSLGCAACHTQVVRPQDVGPWGTRISVAQDYLFDKPVAIGSQRIGPDLKNVGVRRPDLAWHLKHLYDPRLTSEKSSMPPYKFLFREQKFVEGQKPSPDSVLIKDGIEVTAKPEAYQLVSYLFNLHAKTALFEAPLPQPKTNAAPEAVGTNAPATNATATTNSPAK